MTDWNRNGYLVLEDFVSEDQRTALTRRALELVAERDPGGSLRGHSTQEQLSNADDYLLGSSEDIRLFFEESAIDDDGQLLRPLELSINKLGHAMHDLDPVFDQFSRQTGLDAVAAEIGMADLLLLQSMYIFKQPGVGGEVEPHCDHTYLWTEPASVVGFWFAIEDATVDNGCLEVLPGGHHQPPPVRFRVNNQGVGGFEEFGIKQYPVDGFIPLEVAAGTLVVLNGCLPHRSEANTSAVSRHAYTVHAISARAAYRSDNWLQRSTLPLHGWS